MFLSDIKNNYYLKHSYKCKSMHVSIKERVASNRS